VFGAFCLAAASIAAVMPSVARADQRSFTYVYETTTVPQGGFEYEQWVTWEKSKRADSDYDRFSFRHEFEFGITDNLQAALYVDWRYQDGESVDINRVEFRDVAAEFIYSILDPNKDPIGLALYLEAGGGDALAYVEGKVLVQKNVGPFSIAWNGNIEASWEGYNHDQKVGELGQTFGVSMELMPALSVGVEAIHELEAANWKHWGASDNVVWVGPNLSYRQKAWWFTITPVFQVTHVDQEPDFQTRLIFGINF
jgi:hypothetical protein